ncbi:MAG TPA: VOC family protein [Xanthobacteraceae bacterium]|nr:VOC family protein [Xanthobacteraceae bacterium]
MLANKDVAANIPVKDMAKAKKFYEDTLGLKEVGRFGDEVVTFRSGKSDILVYRSEFAGTNKATAMTWTLGDDIDKTVKELKSKGVSFEHYDMPGLKLDGDVYVGDGMKVAWFKDPDGNTLCVVSG